MSHGKVPYPGMTEANVITNTESGYHMPSPKGCLPAIYDTMLKCWRTEPNDRPTFEYLHDHLVNFFKAQDDNGYTCEPVW